MFHATMNFALGDEVEALREMVHRFAQDEIASRGRGAGCPGGCDRSPRSPSVGVIGDSHAVDHELAHRPSLCGATVPVAEPRRRPRPCGPERRSPGGAT